MIVQFQNWRVFVARTRKFFINLILITMKTIMTIATALVANTAFTLAAETLWYGSWNSTDSYLYNCTATTQSADGLWLTVAGDHVIEDGEELLWTGSSNIFRVGVLEASYNKIQFKDEVHPESAAFVDASLLVQKGGILKVGNGFRVDGNGSVTVKGSVEAGMNCPSNIAGRQINVYQGTLTVDGGTFTTYNGYVNIGLNAGGVGNLVVKNGGKFTDKVKEGSDSIGWFIVGNGGNGNLTIEEDSVVDVGSSYFYVGYNGDASVSVSESTLIAGGMVVYDAGTLEVNNAGVLEVDSWAVVESGGDFSMDSGTTLRLHVSESTINSGYVVFVAEGANVSLDNVAVEIILEDGVSMDSLRSVELISGYESLEGIASATLYSASNPTSIQPVNLAVSNGGIVIAIPEPSMFGLFAALGALALVGACRRKRR